MEIDINLLVKKNNYYRIERLFQQARHLTVFLGIVAVLLLLLIFVLQNDKKHQIEVVAAEKIQLEKELVSYKETEMKIKLLNSKVNALNNLKHEAPRYNTYFNQLEKYLPKDPAEGTLKRLSFNSPNIATIEVTFPDILSYTKFLGVTESKEFLDEFESVRFNNIILSSSEQLSLTVYLTFNNATQN